MIGASPRPPGRVTSRGAPGRWLVFTAVGALGLLVQLSTLVALTEACQLDYRVATAVAVELSILHNFLWHERWTWRDRPAPGRRAERLAAFQVASGSVSLVGNVLLTGLLVESLRLHYAVANLTAVAVCALVTFIASDRLVFRKDVRATPVISSASPGTPPASSPAR